MATHAGHIFFIAPYPKDAAPSQRFRFEQYLEDLEKAGYSIEFHPFYDQKAWNNLYAQGKTVQKLYHLIRSFWRRTKLMLQLQRADYIFVHREMSHVGPPIFEWITTKLLKKKIIYDFDDAIWLPNYSAQNAKFQRLKMYKKVFNIMRWAHHVTAGNEFLVSKAKEYNKNVDLIPTTIDLNYHQTTTIKEGKLTIGWTGSHTTAKYLQAIVPVIKELNKDFDFDFVVISNEHPNLDLPNLKFLLWNKDSEIEDLNRIDIGIMPLEENVWTQGKCAFKLLQYMALSKASVASPVGANLEVVEQNENAVFAHTEKEWYTVLKQLLSDETLRRQLGEMAFEKVRDKYSVQSNLKKYLSLFKK